jgi:hypothetical protein
MEKTRLPFLGSGMFQIAREAGAERDALGWYLPPGAIVPAALQARIDAARTDKKRQEVTKSVTPAVGVEPPPPVEFDPALLELIEGMPVDEHRSRVIADYYQARISEIRGTRPDPLAWARSILDRAAKGEKFSLYQLATARGALGR